jgi:Cu/Ag efflux protein CusF
MRAVMPIALAAVACAVIAVPAFAAESACVQRNSIYSTKVIDSSTVLITDINKKQYTLHMTGPCVGLNEASQYLTFRTQGQSELSCLRRGDTIGYNLPGEGTPVRVRPNLQTTCTISTVMEGAPKEDHN